MPGNFTPGQETQYQLNMGLGGTRIWYQGLGEEKNLLTLPKYAKLGHSSP